MQLVRNAYGQIITIAVATGLTVGALGWGLNTRIQRDRLVKELDRVRVETSKQEEVAREEFRESMSVINVLVDYRDRPLTKTDWLQLHHARRFLQERSMVEPEEPDSTFTRASTDRLTDLANLAAITWKLRRFGETEDVLQQLLASLERQAQGLQDAEEACRYAQTLNSMLCLHTHLGQDEKAYDEALQAVRFCEAAVQKWPRDRIIMWNLAVSVRNLGMLQIRHGMPAEDAFHRAIDLTRQCRSRVKQEFTLSDLEATQLICDSHQVIGDQLIRRGQPVQAGAAWQLILDELQLIDEIAQTVSSSGDYSIVPVQKYKTAARRLRLDLKHVAELVDPNSRPSQTGTARFDDPTVTSSWQPLLASKELKHLDSDLLFQGRLPGEFEHQDGVLIVWADEVWHREVYVRLVRELTQTTQVHLVVESPELERQVKEELVKAEIDLQKVRFLQAETDSLWVRDYGPLICVAEDGTSRVVDTWYVGEHNFNRFRDDFLPIAFARHADRPLVRTRVFVESGAILSNGAGLCLASSRIMEMNSESGLNQNQVTAELKRITGADEVVYLDALIDEPTGHLDWFATFTSPDTVVIGDYGQLDSVNDQVLDENAAKLRQVSTPAGPLNVVRIPMPPRGRSYFGGTYTNVVYVNGTLLVPTWPEASTAREQTALQVYRDLLPEWKICPVESYELGRRMGGLHCVIMNLNGLDSKRPFAMRRPDS